MRTPEADADRCPSCDGLLVYRLAVDADCCIMCGKQYSEPPKAPKRPAAVPKAKAKRKPAKVD